ncbi:histone-lysine N-methyltransferase SETD1A [Schistocerca nitens]|uniref:histone-lysine N-methyltransferase SETD1A n=1 Tax=Schistocerca nitens TaxID=7011 RepID=UPI002119491B|nr:histone-lysine N-methyltransferase SETD1A [Schistocerca nitens]
MDGFIIVEDKQISGSGHGSSSGNCSACRISRPYQPVSGVGDAAESAAATSPEPQPQPSAETGRGYSSYHGPYYMHAEDRYHVGAAGKLIDGKIIVGGRGGSGAGGGAVSSGYQYFPPYSDASPGFALGSSDSASSQQVSYDSDSAKDSYQADADMYGMPAAAADAGGDMMGDSQMDDMPAGGGYDYSPPKQPFGLREQNSANSMSAGDGDSGGDQQYRGPVYPYQSYPESYPEEYSYYSHHGAGDDGGGDDEPEDSYMPPEKPKGKKKPSAPPPPPPAHPPPPEYLPPYAPKKKPPPYGGHGDEDDDSYVPYPPHDGGDDDMDDGDDQHHMPPARPPPPPPPPPPDMGHHGYYLPPPPDHHDEPEEPPEYEEHHPKDEDEDSRLNKRPYSYYGIGRKLWYIPLYFSVYFIFYVTALIIKSIARHKIRYPLTHSWNKRSIAEAAGVALVETVQTSLRDAASKYE